MLWDQAKQRNVEFWGQKSENEPGPQSLFCALLVNIAFILHCPKIICASSSCTNHMSWKIPRLEIVNVGRGRTESKGIKTPGPLQEHSYVVLVFPTLCLQLTCMSYLGGKPGSGSVCLRLRGIRTETDL